MLYARHARDVRHRRFVPSATTAKVSLERLEILLFSVFTASRFRFLVRQSVFENPRLNYFLYLLPRAVLYCVNILLLKNVTRGVYHASFDRLVFDATGLVRWRRLLTVSPGTSSIIIRSIDLTTFACYTDKKKDGFYSLAKKGSNGFSTNTRPNDPSTV